MVRGRKEALIGELIELLDENGVQREPMVFDNIVNKLNLAEMESLRNAVVDLVREVRQ